MSAIVDEAERAHLLAFKQAHQLDLMKKHGAHAIGIARKTVNGEPSGRLALVFYVARKERDATKLAAPIPPSFSYLPPGAQEPTALLSDVVEAPAARMEEQAGAER